MSSAEPGKLHAYYEAKGLSPTFGNLRSEEDLTKYSAARARLFTDRLNLPTRLFNGARVLEFGPDTGENALVFARWGATIDLVEPNRQSWPQIEAYFRHFGLAERLGPIADAVIQNFTPERTYDAVVAEGFIHTVQPTSSWIDVARRAVTPGGFLILFYYERTALLVELFHHAAHRAFSRLTGGAGVDTARRLFGAKWDSIPHVRRFESWVMDVLENPYTATRYTLDASHLVSGLSEAGFTLYQSWPRYRNDLRMGWHKAPEPPETVLDEVARHLPRLAVAHALGRTLFAHGPEGDVAEMRSALDRLLSALDAAAATDDRSTWRSVAESLTVLARAVADPGRLYAPRPDDRTAAALALTSLEQLSRLLADAAPDAIADFASTDPAFLATWGQPAHYAVFSRRSEG